MGTDFFSKACCYRTRGPGFKLKEVDSDEI